MVRRTLHRKPPYRPGRATTMINDIRSLCTKVLFASFVVVAPLAAQAAGSPVFDNWTVSNGAIQPLSGDADDAPCAAGFTCEILSRGDGFIQVQWVDTGNAATYIQTIITNPDANGAPNTLLYLDESFVRLGGDNGIMARQRHSEGDPDSVEGEFTNTSQLAIGWANAGLGAPTLSITQSFESNGAPDSATGDEFRNTFSMGLNTNPGFAGRSISVDQHVGMGDGLEPSSDVQRFVLEGRQGVFTEAGDMTLGAPIGSNTNSAGGGTVEWAAGDNVMVRWLGQTVDLVDQDGNSQGVSVFGFQGVLNSTTGDEVTTFSTANTGIVPGGAAPPTGTGYVPPFDWHQTFGTTAPTP